MAKPRLAIVLVATAAANLAQAQTPPELMTAPQAKVAAPPASETTKAGSGSAAPLGDLAAAIAAGDYCKALTLGASARQIYDMRALEMKGRSPFAQPPQLVSFYNDPVGGMGLYWRYELQSGQQVVQQGVQMPLGDLKLPGGNDQLPSLRDLQLPRPVTPPTAEQLALTAKALAGISAEEFAKSLIASQPTNRGVSGGDPATARFTRGPDGQLILFMTPGPGGYSVYVFRNAEGFAGLDKLPAYVDLAGPIALAQRQQARTLPPPPPLNPGDPPNIDCS